MTLFWILCIFLNFAAWFVANVITIYSEYLDAKTGGRFDVSEVILYLFFNIFPFVSLVCIVYKSHTLIHQIFGTTVSDIVTNWIRGEKQDAR